MTRPLLDNTLSSMQANIPLMDESGQAVPFALSILRSPDGRCQICKISKTGPTSPPAETSLTVLNTLATLSFGQTCWLPNPDEPTLRITGQGKLVEVRENRASSEALFMNLADLQAVLAKLASAG